MTHLASKLVFHAPHVDWKGLSPLVAVLGGSVLALMIGLIRPRAVQRKVVPVVAIASLLAAIGLTIWIWKPGDTRPIISGALAVDTLALGISVLFYVAGIATILLSLRSDVIRQTGAGEYACLLLGSIAGMVLLAGAENLVTLFIGIELLFFFFKQKTAYDVGLGIPAEPLFRSIQPAEFYRFHDAEVNTF